MFSIETARLMLRPFTWDDLEFVIALHGDPDVARYIGYGKPRSEAETRSWLESTLTAYDQDQLGHIAVLTKADGTLVGRCGLSLLEIEAEPPRNSAPRCFWNRGSAPVGMTITITFELGYTIAKRYWGNGYATESAAAVRDFAFASRGNDELVAAIFPDNHASKNVARKLGFKLKGEVIAFEMPAELYGISRAELGINGERVPMTG